MIFFFTPIIKMTFEEQLLAKLRSIDEKLSIINYVQNGLMRKIVTLEKNSLAQLRCCQTAFHQVRDACIEIHEEMDDLESNVLVI